MRICIRACVFLTVAILDSFGLFILKETVFAWSCTSIISMQAAYIQFLTLFMQRLSRTPLPLSLIHCMANKNKKRIKKNMKVRSKRGKHKTLKNISL